MRRRAPDVVSPYELDRAGSVWSYMVSSIIWQHSACITWTWDRALVRYPFTAKGKRWSINRASDPLKVRLQHRQPTAETMLCQYRSLTTTVAKWSHLTIPNLASGDEGDEPQWLQVR